MKMFMEFHQEYMIVIFKFISALDTLSIKLFCKDKKEGLKDIETIQYSVDRE